MIIFQTTSRNLRRDCDGIQTQKLSDFDTLCVILVLIMLLTIISYMKRNGIQLVHGTITVYMGGIEYQDGTFLLQTESEIYTDATKTLSLVNSQFHLNLKEGDFIVSVPLKEHKISVDEDRKISIHNG